MNELSFDGRVAVITGAGHGIGRSQALELEGAAQGILVNSAAADSR